MKNNRSIYGAHIFWFHFLGGLTVGAGMGAWICRGLFHHLWAFIPLTAIIALLVAFCCGLWGGSAWEAILQIFSLLP